MSQLPEPWLRGPIEGIDPYLMPAAHAFTQVGEDVAKAVEGLSAEQLWARPGGAASAGFHLRHIVGATERLLTYARGEALSPEQVSKAKAEQGPPSENETLDALLEGVRRGIEGALSELRRIPAGTLLAVGRAALPSNVLGLVFHAAEHAQRHTGQLIATSKAVRG